MHPKYPEVIKLRKKGMSYMEIAKAVGVSKNSVSRWCKNLKLSLNARKILERKSNYSRDLFAKYNKLKSKKAQQEKRRIQKQAAMDIQVLSKYELKLIGAVLYWTEGWTKDVTRKGHGLCFTNSDPDMIKLFLRFLKEVLFVSDEKLSVRIQIHPNISEKAAINFWSKITTIPKERFRINRQISKASKRKRSPNSLPYGTLRVNANKLQNFFQIKGWIDGLIRQT